MAGSPNVSLESFQSRESLAERRPQDSTTMIELIETQPDDTFTDPKDEAFFRSIKVSIQGFMFSLFCFCYTLEFTTASYDPIGKGSC